MKSQCIERIGAVSDCTAAENSVALLSSARFVPRFFMHVHALRRCNCEPAKEIGSLQRRLSVTYQALRERQSDLSQIRRLSGRSAQRRILRLTAN
jgi:hypothetical protein